MTRYEKRINNNYNIKIILQNISNVRFGFDVYVVNE